MVNIHSLTFNPFQENTYILSVDDSPECIVFDPGNSNTNEDNRLLEFLKENELTPTRLINTHCHIDHVLGNQFVSDRFGLELEANELEVGVLQSCDMVSKMYGIPYKGSPPIVRHLNEGETIFHRSVILEIYFTPGHSPGSLCFVERKSKVVIGGDVLFYQSIGRTDLPGGDYQTLINSITEKLLVLDDDFVVYPGHGPKTTIGFERKNNPFLRDL